jgi:Domain of unknown function (DUF4129)
VLPEVLAGLATVSRFGLGRLVADLPPPDHSPARAREAADQILARPEYQWGDDRSVVDRIGEWVADQIGRLTAPFGGSAGGVPTWVGWLVLILLVALVGLLIYRSRAGWRRDRATSPAAGGRVVVSADEGAIDWEAEVARCEAEGRWREALRARYRVLVGELARRRIIGDMVGRTAGELVDEVRVTSPAVAPSFAAATELFEAAWYGGAPVGPPDRDRFIRLAGEVGAAADRSRAPTVVST